MARSKRSKKHTASRPCVDFLDASEAKIYAGWGRRPAVREITSEGHFSLMPLVPIEKKGRTQWAPILYIKQGDTIPGNLRRLFVRARGFDDICDDADAYRQRYYLSALAIQHVCERLGESFMDWF